MEKVKMVDVREAAVVVVGGGIMGCSTAYELAKKGQTVILLEKGFVGAEASGRNGGGVRQQKRDPAELPLAMESVKIWQELQGELEWELEYRQGGNIHILGNPERYDFFVEQLRYSQQAGLDVRLLSPEETHKLLPTLRKDLDLLGSTYCPSDGNANPLFVCKAYAKAAQQLGAQIREHEPLERLEVKSGRVIAAVTAKAEYRASDFVIATGAWAKPICNQIGLDFPIRVKRSQLMVTEPLPPVFTEFLSADQCSCYFRQALSGGMHIGIPSAAIEDHNKTTSYDAFKIAGQSCMTLLPFLEKVNIVHSWAGLTNWTPDAVCIIDKAPNVEGFYLTAGHSGHGFCLGPITGRLLAEWIVDGTPSMDLSAVRWTRFSDIYL
jgi:sarcosine oxidase subunit beta